MNYLPLVLACLKMIMFANCNQNKNDVQTRGPKILITCGSTVRLRNYLTGYHLHSHKFNWEHGSGLQSVAGIREEKDPGSLWIIKEKHGEPKCEPGRIIRCGEFIRLEHVSTGKNLNSLDFPSIVNIEESQEASCSGNDGEGDENNNFMIMCKDFRLRHVKTFRKVYLWHENSRKYLFISFRKADFDKHNCRNCPFIGEKEVGLTYHRDDQSVWEIVDGIILPHEPELHKDDIFDDEEDEEDEDYYY